MNFTWKEELIAAVVAISIMVGLCLVIKYQHDIISKQEVIQKSIIEMKQLSNNVVRSETQYVTPGDLNKFADNLDLKLGPIKDDLKSLNANIKGIQVTKVVSTGSVETNLISDKTEVRKDPIVPGESLDKFGYLKSVQVLNIEEPFSDGKKIPFGEAKFSAWKDKPWDLTVSPRQYTSISVLGQDEDGKHYTYSKFSMTVDGKTYDLKVNDSKFQEEIPASKFSWWNPKFYISLGDGVGISNAKNNVFAGLYFSPFSFGKTKLKPNFIFLQFGPNTNGSSLGLTVSPFQWNIGEYIKVINNTYIGPDLFWINNTFYLGGSISVSL